MKTEKIIVDGKEKRVVLELDEDYIEKNLKSDNNKKINLEDTLDLENTLELDINE